MRSQLLFIKILLKTLKYLLDDITFFMVHYYLHKKNINI